MFALKEDKTHILINKNTYKRKKQYNVFRIEMKASTCTNHNLKILHLVV